MAARSLRIRETVLLPVAMPPVNPMTLAMGVVGGALARRWLVGIKFPYSWQTRDDVDADAALMGLA